MNRYLKNFIVICTVICLVLSMSFAILASNTSKDFFCNYYIQSGNEYISPESFNNVEKCTSISNVLWNTTRSTGGYYYGFYRVNSNGSLTCQYTQQNTVTTTANGAKNHVFSIAVGEYKPYMTGYNGLFIIMTKATVHYTE